MSKDQGHQLEVRVVAYKEPLVPYTVSACAGLPLPPDILELLSCIDYVAAEALDYIKSDLRIRRLQGKVHTPASAVTPATAAQQLKQFAHLIEHGTLSPDRVLVWTEGDSKFVQFRLNTVADASRGR